MVPRRRAGSARFMTGAFLVAASAAVRPPSAPGEFLIERGDAGLHRIFLDHFAPPITRASATLPHQRAARRPA